MKDKEVRQINRICKTLVAVATLVLLLTMAGRCKAKADDYYSLGNNTTFELAEDVPLQTRIHFVQEYNYVSFTVSECGYVWISFDSDYYSDDGYHVCNLYNSSKELISELRFKLNALKSQESGKIGLDAGTYYLYTYGTRETIILNFEANSYWEKEINDTPLDATAISINHEIYGSSSVKNGDFKKDVDWYMFTLNEDGYIELAFNHEYVNSDDTNWGNYVLYNSNNVEIYSQSFRQKELGPFLSDKLGLKAGEYYLRVGGHAVFCGACNYTFTINYYSSDEWEKEINNTVVEANEISINKLINGTIQDHHEEDWFKFSLLKGGIVRLSISERGAEVLEFRYGISDSHNNSITASNKSQIIGENGMYQSDTFSLEKGNYYLRIYNDGRVYDKGKQYAFSVDFSENGSFDDLTIKEKNVDLDNKEGEGSGKNSNTKTSADCEKVGEVISSGKINYKVLNKDEVSVVGLKSSAEKITIPSSITVGGVKYDVVEIDENAFKGNKKLKRVIVKADLDLIGESAFSECLVLARVDLIGDTSEIGRKAFYKCKKLKQIFISTDSIERIGSKAFSKIVTKAQVKVPKGMKKSYTNLLIKGGLSSKAKIKE